MIFLPIRPVKAVDIMSLSTHDRSGLSHDIVLPGTIDKLYRKTAHSLSKVV